VTPLERLIRARIAAEGPMGVDAYMALALGHPEHGYYATRDPLGAAGDFTTAPEISQMFGELVGAWLAQVWHDQGAPAPVTLAELGPGRGTLMRDVLRVAERVPGFRAALRPWLVETSAALRRVQAAELAGSGAAWAPDVGSLPGGPLLVVANEFFDALPVRQLQKVDALWRERRVGLDAARRLAFVWGAPRPDPDLARRFDDVPDGAIVEVSPAGAAVMAALAARISAHGGAVLIVDYGAEAGHGDTLQAVRGHAVADPLAAPGEADLTAHVRFADLAAAAGPLRVSGPAGQGVFLERLGITARARALAAGKDPAAADAVAAAHRRLTHPEEMGDLFRVIAVSPPASPPPPGFGA